MTVRELITHLQTLPQDWPVIYRCYSDWSVLEAEDVEAVDAEERKLVEHHNMPDQVRDYNQFEYEGPYAKKLKGTVPKFVSAVTFPGN